MTNAVHFHTMLACACDLRFNSLIWFCLIKSAMNETERKKNIKRKFDPQSNRFDHRVPISNERVSFVWEKRRNQIHICLYVLMPYIWHRPVFVINLWEMNDVDNYHRHINVSSYTGVQKKEEDSLPFSLLFNEANKIWVVDHKKSISKIQITYTDSIQERKTNKQWMCFSLPRRIGMGNYEIWSFFTFDVHTRRQKEPGICSLFSIWFFYFISLFLRRTQAILKDK